MKKTFVSLATPSGHPVVPWFLRSGTRLFATLLLVLAVPFAAFSLEVALSAGKRLETQAFETNLAAASLGADAVEAHFEGLAHYIESYARRPDLAASLEAGDATAIRSHLEELVRHNKNLARVFITDVEGIERYDSPPDPAVIGQSFAHRDWYKGVTPSGRAYVSEIYVRAAAPPCDIVAIAVAIGGEGRKPLGYLVGQYTIEALVQRLAQIRPSQLGTIRVLDQYGHVAIARTDFKTAPRSLAGIPIIEEMRAAGEVSRVADDPVTRVPSLLSSARVKTIEWLVVAQLPAADVYEPVKAFQRSIALVSLLCLAGMLGLGFIWLNVVRRHHLALLELQRQKDLLSGMILHDLRNPLAATLGSIDLIRAQTEEMGPILREDVTRAAHSAKRVRDLLNTLLDIMRMEEGVLEVHAVRQDLGDLVRTKADEFRPLAEAAALTLRESVPAQPVEASVDPDLMGRVLDNLITNAVKHTPRGGRVEVALDHDREKERVILTVSDTGEGIPAEAMPLLFQKFASIGGQEMKRPYDVGLGLVFCRMAIELHGGTIEARSEQGRGSAFRIVLPLLPK